MERSINISSSFRIDAAGTQWIGARTAQEDSIYLSPEEENSGTFLAILADGMGGMGDGEKASSTLTKQFACYCSENGISDLVTPLKVANAKLGEAKAEGLITSEAGATLIALCVDRRQLRWLSVGDSLLYRQRGTEITKLNNAHTWQWELDRRVQSGEMSREQADAAPGPRHALFAAVCGDEVISAADVSESMPYCEGDRFIIASDGLQPLVDQGWENILNAPENRKASPAVLRNLLLRKIQEMQLPNQDNTSIIVIDILPHKTVAAPHTPHEPADSKAPYIRAKAKDAIAVSILGNRTSQQDAVGCWQSERALFAVVADGAGGHAGGAIAARMAVDGLEKLWKNTLSAGVPVKSAGSVISDALKQIHSGIISTFGGKASRSGKCAIVALYVFDNCFACVNAGDCRGYISGAECWQQLSIDDSLLRFLIESGEVSPKDARNHPDQNILTQALGSADKLTPHIRTGSCSGKCSFLLCCDGLWNQLPEPLLRMDCWSSTEQHNYSSALSSMAQTAVGAASGKSDNVSAVWIFPAHAQVTPTRKSRILISGILAISVFCCSALGWFSWQKISSAQQENNHLRAKLSAQAQRLESETLSAQQASAATNAEIDRLKKEVLDAQQANAAANAEIDRLKKEALDAQQAAANSNAEIERLKADINRLQKQNNQQTSNPSTSDTPPDNKQNADHAAPPSDPALKDGGATGTDYAPHQNETQLVKAAKNNDIETVRLLLEESPDIDVNEADKHGRTPLNWAAWKGHTEVVRMLLAAPGIDVNRADKYGETPLYRAACFGHTEIVRLLLAAPGIDVEKTLSVTQWSMLHLAASAGLTEQVQELIAAGEDVNKADNDGQTPLDKANTKEIKRMLRAAGRKTGKQLGL